jgi:hypothetical protein
MKQKAKHLLIMHSILMIIIGILIGINIKI